MIKKEMLTSLARALSPIHVVKIEISNTESPEATQGRAEFQGYTVVAVFASKPYFKLGT